MHNLTVRHKIKLPLHQIIGVPGLTFSKWFPLEDKDRIIVHYEGKKVEIWFDRSCLILGQREAILEKHINVISLEAYVAVTVFGVSNEIVEFLKDNLNEIKNNDEELKKQAQVLGETVYTTCINILNKIINYFRHIKNQYWLEEIYEDKDRIYSFNVDVNAEATTNDINTNDWFRWSPFHTDVIKVLVPDEEVYITKDDWEKVKEFVNSGKRINFALELVSKAKVLKSIGYVNNAIVDSVIALEIAFNAFGKQPNREMLISLGLNLEIDSSLENSFSHLGFSTSVKYLLPIILPNDLIDKLALGNVNELINIRHNIIHAGQKRVKYEKLKLINSAEKLTKLLIELTLQK